ncbi:MAG: cytochrome c oxidase subunit [Verrucomicrobia bacterium]|nr:cytochrome c oxidase subunit [Verrucomicrobiota bacterium]
MKAEGTRVESPYVDAAQRALAQQLGMWAFIATEVLLFGGLFIAYAVYRVHYPDAFADGSRRLDFWIGTINTAVLLASSLAMAIADIAVRRDRRRLLSGCLAMTWLLGALFLVLKGYEYHQKFVEHLIPGPHFAPAGGPAAPEQLFFVLYFAMTGLHAVHMVIGLGVIAWLFVLSRRGRLGPASPGRVELAGLYWHFVDCVWVFLYPLLYLIR